jgi:hypothetical protein
MLSGPEYSFISSLMHDPSVGVSVCGIATARRRLQSLAVEYGYPTAFIFDQSPPVQGAGGECNTDPAYAKHESQKFVGHVEAVGMGAILHHQDANVPGVRRVRSNPHPLYQAAEAQGSSRSYSFLTTE